MNQSKIKNAKNAKTCAPDFSEKDAARVIIADFENFHLFEEKSTKRGFHSRIHALIVLLSPTLTSLSKNSRIGTTRFKGYKSEAVLIAERKGKPLPKSKVILDHSVPIKCIYDELEELYAKRRLTVRRVEKLLRRMVVCALITREEDEILTKAGLRSKMPEGWPDDVFARYKECGIRIGKQG
jgi:hypothetical protein